MMWLMIRLHSNFKDKQSTLFVFYSKRKFCSWFECKDFKDGKVHVQLKKLINQIHSGLWGQKVNKQSLLILAFDVLAFSHTNYRMWYR